MYGIKYIRIMGMIIFLPLKYLVIINEETSIISVSTSIISVSTSDNTSGIINSFYKTSYFSLLHI